MHKLRNTTPLEQSSDKASVIRVPGGLTSGLHTRISLGGLREWHIFGSIRYIAFFSETFLAQKKVIMPLPGSVIISFFEAKEKTQTTTMLWPLSKVNSQEC
jgi:hypothetical protein